IGKKAAKELFHYMDRDLTNKVIYGEIRNLCDYSSFKDIFSEFGWGFQPHLNFHLDCSSETRVWQNLNNNRSRQIKKALKVGVTISEAVNLDEVTAFYNILLDLYRNKIKKPLFPFEFFKKFFENNLGKYLLVWYKGEIIGGIQCPILWNKVIYEFYICGKDLEYKEASPSVMATFAAIEYGVKHNLKYFDFMGAGKPDEDYGVRDFKAKFGGELIGYGRFLRVFNPLLFSMGKKALRVLKKIKK
ncbi:MAG: peptidoglycan bridge formation glycyltransferase FemA/FemB family protein, partial [Bacteroidota bacterium]